MKRLISLLLIVITLSSLLAGCEWNEFFDWENSENSTSSTTNSSKIPNSPEIIWEEKEYCDATIEDDFVPGHVLILLDRAISEPNKIHEKEFFAGVEIEEIIDLTKRENPVDPDEEFRQILALILVEKTKEAVIKACKILEQIEGIKAASPDYYFYPEETPNDEYYTSIYRNYLPYKSKFECETQGICKQM